MSIFDKWTDLDPALALKRIEEAHGSAIFTKYSYLDPALAILQIEEALDIELDNTALDFSQLEDDIDEALDDGGVYVGPLDIISGALVAFSLSRALSIDWIGQNVVTLRRDSDDATMDFVAGADGLVDVAAVTAWLDGANGYVTTVWDQSGNANDCVQADTTKQPPWVADAVNDHPAMQIVDPITEIAVTCGATSYPDAGFTAFVVGRGKVCRFTAVAGGNPDIEFNASRLNLFFPIDVLDNDGNEYGCGSSSTFDDTAYHLYDGRAKWNDSDHYSDGLLDTDDHFADGVEPSSGFTILNIRWLIGGGNTGDICGSSEAVMYPTFPTNLDRVLVRENIAEYYGITLTL